MAFIFQHLKISRQEKLKKKAKKTRITFPFTTAEKRKMINNISPPTTPGFLVDNGEFFIRSSGSPFTFTRSSFSAADFFPSEGHSSDYDVIFNTPQTPGIPYPPPGKGTEAEEDERHSEEEGQDGSQEETEGGSGGSLGQLRHTRDKLRLEIPSMNLTRDSAGGSEVSENGGTLEYGDQSSFVLLASRAEPEVSEV